MKNTASIAALMLAAASLSASAAEPVARAKVTPLTPTGGCAWTAPPEAVPVGVTGGPKGNPMTVLAYGKYDILWSMTTPAAPQGVTVPAARLARMARGPLHIAVFSSSPEAKVWLWRPEIALPACQIGEGCIDPECPPPPRKTSLPALRPLPQPSTLPAPRPMPQPAPQALPRN